MRTVVREPVQSVRLECTVHNPILTDGPTWDCAAVSLRAIDQNGNLLPYCGEAVQLSVDGPLKIIGPSVVPLRGGMAGTYLATTGEAGRAVLHCRMEGALDTDAVVTIRCREAVNFRPFMIDLHSVQNFIMVDWYPKNCKITAGTSRFPL